MRAERPASGTRYEDDFAAWAEEQAAVLAGGRWNELDVEHLVEEVGDLSRSLDHALVSHLKVLLAHILEREFQPERQTHSCKLTEHDQADEIEELLRESPSRRTRIDRMVATTYRRARRLAARDTEMPLETFPAQPPATVLASLRDALERAHREAESS